MREIVRRPGAHRRPDELLRERARPRPRARGRAPAAPGPTHGRCSPSRRSTTCARSSTTASPWARLNFMLCAAGAFQLWRRDLVEDLGGWSRGVHLRGHRVHLPRAPSPARARARLPDRLPPRLRRRHRGPGHREEARLAARAVAARDPRDVLGEQADVVQPALRDGRSARRAVLPRLGDPRAGVRGRSRSARSSRAGSPGSIDWWEFAVLTLLDHVRQQRAHDRRAADARPRGAGVSPLGRRAPPRR